MKKRIIFGMLAVASITAAAYAAPVVKTVAGGADGAGYAKMDSDGDGNVSKSEALAHAEARFAVMDTDGNGQIDASDRQARAKLRFAEMDVDKNGTVNEAEFITAANAKAAARASGRAAKAKSPNSLRSAYSGSGSGSDAKRNRGRNRDANNVGSWGKGDTNNDQAISRAEYDAAAGSRFAARDKDGNGALSADEMKSARNGIRARVPQSDKMEAG